MANFYIPLVASPPIGDNSGGGGSNLPDVSAADNGDVLTVVNGQWAKAEPSGGGGVLVVTITYDEGTGDATLDKTAEEIWTAYRSGTVLIGESVEQGGVIVGYFDTLISALYMPGSTIAFVAYDIVSGSNITFTATSGDDYPKQEGS